jgi:hypothetical protein
VSSSAQGRRCVAALGGLAVGAALLGGCSGGPAAPVATPTGPVDIATQARQAKGVDPEQLAVFDDGDVTYDEYETAMGRAFDCMRDGGLKVVVAGTKTQNGVTVLSYTIAGTSRETDLAGPAGRKLQDDCYDRAARYVDSYWQVSSDDAVAYFERRAAALTPPLRTCLTDAGGDFPADASFDELLHVAVDLTEKDPASDCIGEIGYSSWQG